MYTQTKKRYPEVNTIPNPRRIFFQSFNYDFFIKIMNLSVLGIIKFRITKDIRIIQDQSQMRAPNQGSLIYSLIFLAV